MGKTGEIPVWQLTKVRNKKEVINEARTKGQKVHFASLMDLCHLEKSELELQYQKFKGGVVLHQCKEEENESVGEQFANRLF